MFVCVKLYSSMHNKNNNNYHTQLQVEQHNLISNYYMRNNLLPLGNVCFSKGYVWCMNWVMIIASNRWGKRYTQAFWTYRFMQYKTFTLVETKSKYQIGWKAECIQRIFVNNTKNLVIEKLLLWLSKRYKR